MTNVIKVFSELIKPSLIEEEWRYLAFFFGDHVEALSKMPLDEM